uniref:non-specific serine/threonine protein kinase n=1 Tax=Panagrellus redivivus TaxID=6233 RepID=A0A7E4ZR40_PANRE
MRVGEAYIKIPRTLGSLFSSMLITKFKNPSRTPPFSPQGIISKTYPVCLTYAMGDAAGKKPGPPPGPAATGGPEEDDEEDIDFKQGHVINKRWQVERKLGAGNCGAVYLVRDLQAKAGRGKSRFALKMEPIIEGKMLVLKKEVDLLKNLIDRKHVPRLHYSARRPRYTYMVMTLYGKNIFELKKDCKLEVFTPGCVSRIGIHALYGVKQLHEVGFVHRDVKPANMVIGRGKEARVIYVVDFGMARRYAIWEGGKVHHREARETALFRGSFRYCSPHVHDRHEQGRRDDLWSVMYSMIFLLNGTLPWVGKSVEADIKASKNATTDEQLLAKAPPEYLVILKHIRSLGYKQRPDYKLIYDQLRATMDRLKVTFFDPYDWERVNKSNRTQSMSLANSYDEKNNSQKDKAKEKPLEPVKHGAKTGKSCERIATPTKVTSAESKSAPKPGKSEAKKKDKSNSKAVKKDDKLVSKEEKTDRTDTYEDTQSPKPSHEVKFPTTDPAAFARNDIGL